jgi:hypothetical protein
MAAGDEGLDVAKRLIVSDGRSERALLLVANIVVGRDPMCEISGDDSLLSRRHAEFVVGGAQVLVRDLGSRNGVYVNGLKVAEKPLCSNDLVRIGHLELRYVEDAMPLSAALVAAMADSTAVVPAGAPLGPRRVPAPGSRDAADADDDDRTRLVGAPAPSLTLSPAAENEHTRLVTPPMSRETARSLPLDESHDEERTRLMRPQASSSSATLAAAVPSRIEPSKPKTAPVPASMPPRAVPALAVSAEPGATAPRHPSVGFVFAHVALLALVVAVAAMAPFLIEGQSALAGSPAAFGLSVGVIILTTYVLGARIAGRVRAAGDSRDRGAD